MLRSQFTWLRRSLGGALALALLSSPVAARPVTLELILAVDSSMSVDVAEFALQMAGYAEAFRHPAVQRAIAATAPDGIAVTLVQFAESYQQAVVLDWTWMGDGQQAAGFADRVASVGRQLLGPGTALTAALRFAVALFQDNGYEGQRRVIDLSGDGRDNRAPTTTPPKAAAVAAGVTVNGLAIISEDRELTDYYRREVIAGSDAFVLAVRDYQGFAEALVDKLLREIQGLPLAALPGAPRRPFAALTPPAPWSP